MKNEGLAKRIKALRNRRGFSQEELSEKSGLSLRTIQRVENNETASLGNSLKKISNALDVNPEELIDWTIKEDRGYLTPIVAGLITINKGLNFFKGFWGFL